VQNRRRRGLGHEGPVKAEIGYCGVGVLGIAAKRQRQIWCRDAGRGAGRARDGKGGWGGGSTGWASFFFFFSFSCSFYSVRVWFLVQRRQEQGMSLLEVRDDGEDCELGFGREVWC
jgi:hypothetical protein